MLNLELKARLSDRAAVEARLRELGARREWTRRMRDTFFPVPRGWLKLREADGVEAELIAYLRPTDDAGVRGSEWHAVRIADPRALERTLEHVLGRDKVVAKERTLWLHGATRIHLDRVDSLGDFLELETIVAKAGDRAAAERECAALRDRLGVRHDDLVAVPYRDLLP